MPRNLCRKGNEWAFAVGRIIKSGVRFALNLSVTQSPCRTFNFLASLYEPVGWRNAHHDKVARHFLTFNHARGRDNFDTFRFLHRSHIPISSRWICNTGALVLALGNTPIPLHDLTREPRIILGGGSRIRIPEVYFSAQLSVLFFGREKKNEVLLCFCLPIKAMSNKLKVLFDVIFV